MPSAAGGFWKGHQNPGLRPSRLQSGICWHSSMVSMAAWPGVSSVRVVACGPLSSKIWVVDTRGRKSRPATLAARFILMESAGASKRCLCPDRQHKRKQWQMCTSTVTLTSPLRRVQRSPSQNQPRARHPKVGPQKLFRVSFCPRCIADQSKYKTTTPHTRSYNTRNMRPRSPNAPEL